MFLKPLRKTLLTRNSIKYNLRCFLSSNVDWQKYDSEQVHYMKETIPIVDENDNVLRPGSKKECHLLDANNDLILHRAFSAFIFNHENRLLIQQRASEKITFPSFWANSCCSHPLHNKEELDERENIGVKLAAIRKIEHELGMTGFEVKDLTFLTKVLYKGIMENDIWGEYEMDYCLVAKKPFEIEYVQGVLNKNEIAEVKLVDKEELKDMLKRGESGELLITPWFRIICEKFLFSWWDAVERDDVSSVVDEKRIQRFA